MRITELLVESQLDEGPFTQAVGKVGGKIAKGIANVGKDLKTGFKAGYSGEQPAANPDAKPSATTQGIKQGLNKAFGVKAFDVDGDTLPTPDSGDYGQLSNDESKIWNKKTQQWEPYDKTAKEKPAPSNTSSRSTTAAPAASADTSAAPAADPAAEKAAKIGVGQINKIIPTLRTRDLMSLQANLEKTIASKQKAAPEAPKQQAAAKPNWDEETGAPLTAKAKAEYATFSPEQQAEIQKKIANKKLAGAKQNVAASQAEIDADRARLMGTNSESAVKKGRIVAEGFSLFRKQA